MRISLVLTALLVSTMAVPWTTSAEICSSIERLEFNGQYANESVTTQVDFGARVPGSNASEDLRNWFMETRPEFDWNLDPHVRDGYNLTNLEGRLVLRMRKNWGQLSSSLHTMTRGTVLSEILMKT